jgi:predicted HicB family RNase H-like nuclease
MYNQKISEYEILHRFFVIQIIFIVMSKSKYPKTLIVRITESQLRMIVSETINEQISLSNYVRGALNEKLKK